MPTSVSDKEAFSAQNRKNLLPIRKHRVKVQPWEIVNFQSLRGAPAEDARPLGKDTKP